MGLEEEKPTQWGPGGLRWTLDTLHYYTEAQRRAQERFEAERDRRYAEIAAEREKAAHIKEAADDRALQLAREIQTYKDEKANELRTQLAHEREEYATKRDLESAVREIKSTLGPLFESATLLRGQSLGRATLYGYIISGAALVISAIYFFERHSP